MRKFQLLLAALILAALPMVSTHAAAAQPETFEGHLNILRADNFTTGVTTTSVYLVKTPESGGQTLLLNIPDGLTDSPLRSGDRVTVVGVLNGGAVDVQQLRPVIARLDAGSAVSALDLPDLLPAYEDRRAVILILDFEDAANSLSVSDVAGFMYSNDRNVHDLYMDSSFQQLGFNSDTDDNGAPDVFGPFPIDFRLTDGCDPDGWANAANAAAAAADVNLSIYQHKVYALPAEAPCGWSGLGSVGCNSYWCSVWVIDGGGPVFAHELGHNLGWHHASTDPENDGQINSEYGDRSGIMGYPYWSQVIAPHRDHRGWFDAFPGSLQVASTSGTYELYPLELDQGADDIGTQVVKFNFGDSGESYYLSYRRRIGQYPVHSNYEDMINIHRSAGPRTRSAHLTNLEQGQSFSDNANGITVTADATGGDTATVTVTIAGTPVNNPPIAGFNFNTAELTVQFADTSQDSDGNITVRAWDFGDGNQSSETNPTHAYTAPGTYTVTLTVTDDDGATAGATRRITLVQQEDNQQPTASFNCSIENLQLQCTDTSSDSDGTIAVRSWNFGDGNRSSQANPAHTYEAPGTYVVTLMVTDDDGATATAQQNIATNTPPEADFTMTVKGRQVTFTQNCSDEDGTIQSYMWDFGDGETSDGADPVHTYAADGTFTVTLTVQDSGGASATFSADVDLTENATSGVPAPSSETVTRASDNNSSGCFIHVMQ